MKGARINLSLWSTMRRKKYLFVIVSITYPRINAGKQKKTRNGIKKLNSLSANRELIELNKNADYQDPAQGIQKLFQISSAFKDFISLNSNV